MADLFYNPITNKTEIAKTADSSFLLSDIQKQSIVSKYGQATLDNVGSGFALPDYTAPQTGGGLTTTADATASAEASRLEQERIKAQVAAEELAQKSDPSGAYAPSLGTGAATGGTTNPLSKNNPYGLPPNTSGPNGVMTDANGFVIKTAAPAAAAPGAAPGTPTAVVPNAPTQVNQPAPALSLTSSLQRGMTSPQVSELQKLLGVATDGVYGPKTEAAVKAFQASHGLIVDGIVGAKTLAALNASKAGPAPVETVAAGAGSSTSKTSLPSTGNPAIDALLQRLNNQSPQKTASDVMKEIITSLGIDTMNSDYKNTTQQFKDLQDKKNEEIQEINNNPWFTEGVRVGKLRQLDSKYEGKETNLTNKLKLLETQISNGRADAQFILGKTLDQLEQSSKMSEDIILKAIDIAEKESEARTKANAPSDYKPPTSYQEWQLAGKPGTYADWLKEQNVKAPTTAQQTVATYATRIEQANPLIDSFSKSIVSMNPLSFEAQKRLPSYLQSDDYQAYDQASRNFINATLRRESGAAINASEFDNAYKQYLPRPGDTEQTLKQKKANRDVVYASLKKAAGNAYESVDSLLGTNSDPLGLGI